MARADFGFNFTCEMDGQEQGCDQGPDHVPRHPAPAYPRASGSPALWTNVFRGDGFDATWIRYAAVRARPSRSRDAQFQGNYRSQETIAPAAPGRFTVLVFDQGEPGRTKDPQITGDGFSIDLRGGPYTVYTRAGYIEGGNIQVDNT